MIAFANPFDGTVLHIELNKDDAKYLYGVLASVGALVELEGTLAGDLMTYIEAFRAGTLNDVPSKAVR